MRLTSAADYAIRAMIYMACLPENTIALRSEIADSQGIPSSFTAKILRKLVQANLLISTRGVNGGFGLARPATEINLLDVVEAIDGPLTLNKCATDPESCTRALNCPACLVWSRIQEDMVGTLREANLEALVSVPRRNGRVTPMATLWPTAEPADVEPVAAEPVAAESAVSVA
jgi:Rrf2 family protein